ncbi:hypothetical protein D4A35_18095 (plasmid) [Paraclostridium bifermentans]|uniref:DUF2178 domain-containing protein n=1 Tax=Paraclostridium bifermentans TaxID=1490 RepID=A0A5P3XKF7_PARBF|nr:hypothetical protein [Paraclostridium bifermentans]QEZ70847.1 hypothetical protein D4A35_18095 [Paraclostridium bifermentans]
MRKNNFYSGVISILIGISLILISLIYSWSQTAILWGIAGVLFGYGINVVSRYVSFKHKSKKPGYLDEVKRQKIAQTDERNKLILYKSGYITYYTLLFIQIIIILVVSLLMIFSIVDVNPKILIALVLYTLFMCICNKLIFTNTKKRY